jgi:hypothetical protein
MIYHGGHGEVTENTEILIVVNAAVFAVRLTIIGVGGKHCLLEMHG